MDWILHTPPQFIALLALLGTPRSGSRKGPQPAPAGPRPPSDAGRGAAGRRLALGRGAAGVPALPASATRLLHTFTKMCGSLARKTCRRRGRGCRARRGMQDGGPAPGPAPRTPNPAPAPRTPTPDPEPGPRTRTPVPDPGPGPRTRTRTGTGPPETPLYGVFHWFLKMFGAVFPRKPPFRGADPGPGVLGVFRGGFPGTPP